MAGKLILSIDGGGIRCLISAYILVELQRRMRASGRMRPLHCYFDMISASGLGAIIGASLAYARADCSERLPGTPEQLLEDLKTSGTLFSARIPSASGQMLHDSHPLETFLRKRFGSHTQVDEALTRVVYPAFDISRRMPIVITDTDRMTSQFYLWQALRGTVAIPRYLTPGLVENRADRKARGTPLIPVVGGGRYSEDPALAAYVQARKLGWHEGDGFNMFSIGCGRDMSPIPFYNTHSFVGLNITDVTEPLLDSTDDLHCPISNHVNILMNGDTRAFTGVATRITSDLRDRLTYFRVNGSLRKASSDRIDMSPKNIENLGVDAARIIAENGPVLDEMVRRMPKDLPTFGADSLPSPSLSKERPVSHSPAGGIRALAACPV